MFKRIKNELNHGRSQDFGSGVVTLFGIGAEPHPKENGKLQMHYFSILLKKFNKPCVNFSAVWTKNTNCWEILNSIESFDENSIEN